MDQLPRSNEGFSNSNMFADSQQFNVNPYDSLFQAGTDQNSYDASWGINASAYPGQSRAPQSSAQAWPQNANHLSTASTHPGLAGQASPYGRSLSQSPAPYGQNHFQNYAGQQSFQYRQPQYDPTLVSPHTYGQGFNYATTNYQTPNPGTIAPHALEHETRTPIFNQTRYTGGDYPMGNTNQVRPAQSFTTEIVDQKALANAIPTGNPANYFSIINFDHLANSTKSERMGNFVNIGKEARNWDVNRAALPAYIPRKSRNELRKLAGNDPKILAKLGKKSMKKEKLLAPTTRHSQLTPSGSSPTLEKTRYEGEASSDEDSSSDENSDTSYSSDEPTEAAPLPPKRPSSPKEATEYDTIKALWRGKSRSVKSESIRKGIIDYWQIIKTIRDRWKADSTAVTEAETKKRENELPLLKSRVKDQRDMMESAFKAALKYGHRDIIGLLSENVPLLFVCYQFLLDRSKVDDTNGTLSRVILETMVLFTTLSDEKLEKTHLDKIIPRLLKKGDAKTQGYVKRVMSNASNGTKTQPMEASKKPMSKSIGASSPTGKQPELQSVAGIKRAASTAGEGGSQKKLAMTATKTNSTLSTLKQNVAAKKPGSAVDSMKPAAPTVVKAKPVTAKPSGMFSSLQSAAKKPGTSIAAGKAGQGGTVTSRTNEKPTTASTAAPKSTFSFAETMANLSKPKEEKPAPKPEKEMPQETADEKAKRLKKESRRNLRVQFKAGDELVQVRVFQHDPDEELGHDASQMRDVADVGGEGRMFKQQHQMMDLDDDEDAAEEEEKLMEFKAPNDIDFSDVDEEERKRNYAPFGGGQLKVESEERARREYYEANNLIVFYTKPSDIPPNPREPADPNNGEMVDVKDFHQPPEDKWALRARQKKLGASQYFKGAQQASTSNAAAPLDLSKLQAFLNTQQQQPSVYQPTPQPNAIPSNINNILASIQPSGAGPSAPAPAPPPLSSYGYPYAPPQPSMTMQPQQPTPQPNSGQLDLAGILAKLAPTLNTAAQAPQMSSYNYGAPNIMPNMTGYGSQTQQSGLYEDPARKQWREGGANDMSRAQRSNPAQNPYYKTKVCKYWLDNACQKGDKCTYKHG